MDSFCNYVERMPIRQISILMCILTLFTPNFVSSYPHHDNGAIGEIGYIIACISWVYSTAYSSTAEGFQLMNLELVVIPLIFTLPLVFHSILVVQYCQGKSTSREVWRIAVLSIVIPTLFGLTPMILVFMSYGIFAYTGTIPIQLILGYLVVRYKRPQIEDLPWKDGDPSKHIVTNW